METRAGATGDVTLPAHETVLAEQQLDPGIADIVIMLRNLGFNPTDSGDGRSKPDDQRDFDVKHVACAWCPPADETQTFFGEARRLQSVLGAGWRVEASFTPDDNSYILLATKNEEPGPRHIDVMRAWPWEARAWLVPSDTPVVPAAEIATSIIDRLRDAPLIESRHINAIHRILERAIEPLSEAIGRRADDLTRLGRLYDAGGALHKALEHELGRR